MIMADAQIRKQFYVHQIKMNVYIPKRFMQKTFHFQGNQWNSVAFNNTSFCQSDALSNLFHLILSFWAFSADRQHPLSERTTPENTIDHFQQVRGDPSLLRNFSPMALQAVFTELHEAWSTLMT